MALKDPAVVRAFVFVKDCSALDLYPPVVQDPHLLSSMSTFDNESCRVSAFGQPAGKLGLGFSKKA